MGLALADTADDPHHTNHERRPGRVIVPAINVSRRLILPALGVAVFLLAYVAQNVWHLFHIDDITRSLRGLDMAGLVAGMVVLGMVEGTIVLCFYLPGTAVVIVLLLGMQPSLVQALPLVAGLMVGTLIGYCLSLLLGKVLQQKLPSLVGEAYFRRVQSFIERYGLVAFIIGAFHPNQLALGFAILGYFRVAWVWRYLLVAAVAQVAWWGIYAAAADLVAGQNLVSTSNFQLYVAGLFAIWLVYELLSRPHPQNIP
jgi:membrane protein DedA with SNARE-associated domain